MRYYDEFLILLFYFILEFAVQFFPKTLPNFFFLIVCFIHMGTLYDL